jgi:uncharacterized protein YggT (Ycf19 family)
VRSALGIAILGFAADIGLVAFVPAADSRQFKLAPGHMLARGGATAVAADRETRGSTAPDDADYAGYDWQRLAEDKPDTSRRNEAAATAAAPAFNPDLLPDFPDEEEPPDSAPQVSSLGANVRVRELSLPEIPGDPDILPPEPNAAWNQSVGLFEWTGIWIVGLLVIAAIGYAASYFVARAKLEPAFADSLLSATKVFCSTFEVMLLGRILLAQFPKLKPTEFPWAVCYYPTELLLSPTRMVFKPEAGVDIAPIIWLLTTLLIGELFAGPAGILVLARDTTVR